MEILVVHATAGAGHKKAAEAVYNGLKTLPGCHVTLVDALDYTYPFFKKTYPGVYTWLVTRAPWVWRIAFAILNIPWLQGVIRLIRAIHNSIHAHRFERFLKDKNFDIIISTQFLSVEVASRLKRRQKIKSRVICCVTDFDVHRIWISKGTDDYAVATSFTKNRLLEYGIPGERVHLTGIPTDLKFSLAHNVSLLKRSFGLDENQFTILLATGSFGFGPIETIVKGLDNCQMLVVCGHNQDLYTRLNKLDKKGLVVFGLVDNMHELMAVSDCMVTKPGGLSISEALVCGLPMIFFSAIPGQEINNVRVLQTYGVSSGICRVDAILEQINQFKSNPQALKLARQKSKNLGKPASVDSIIKIFK